MTAITDWYRHLELRAARMRIVEIASIKLAVFFMTLFFVKLIPELLILDWGWYLALALILSLPANYRFWRAEHHQ